MNHQYRNLVTPELLNQPNEATLFKVLHEASLINGAPMYMGRLAQRASYLFKDRTALINKQTSISFNQLYARACAVSMRLREQGVQPHDRVLLLWENSIEFYIAYFGIVQIGAVVAPLNVFLQEREIAHIINDAQPRAMIISDELRPRLANIPADQLPLLIGSDAIAACGSYDTIDPDFQITDLDPDEMVALLYTSGTTGFPKGVMTSSRNCMTNVIQGLCRIGINMDQNERFFCILPLFHSFAQFACVWAPLLGGSAIIIVPRIERRYLLDGLALKPTIFFGVPALYGLLCLLKNAPLDSVKYFVSGGDALPDKIRSAFALIYRRKICSGYGLTETSPLLAGQIVDEAVPTNCVGPMVCGVQAQVRDEQGNLLPEGSIGQLWVKGDNIMLGYYNAPEATAAVLQDGWFCTGDMVYFDDNQRLIITGRAKDIIVNKGFKIYPQEIENLIMSHPAVIRVAVVGRPDSAAGEVPVAYVQVKAVTQTIKNELTELCIKSLAGYKNPRDFIITEKNIPTTATGKVDKKRLNELN